MTLPHGFTVRVRDDVRLLPTADGGLSLVGGSPLRSMRLKPTAADRVTGRQVQVHNATTDLIVRRLLDGNLADPAGLAPIEPAELTVIVPAHDRSELLDHCLAALNGLDIIVEAQIEDHLAPFADTVERLDEVPGIGRDVAAIIIAEIGVDMTRFPTPGHLASWAKFAPGIKSSSGKTKGNGSTDHGNRYLARALGAAAINAGRTNTFLGVRYRRIARRRGRKKAQVAVGRSQLVIIYHLLADPTTRFHDLGPDHYDRHVSTTAKKRSHLKAFEALGYRVTLEPAA